MIFKLPVVPCTPAKLVKEHRILTAKFNIKLFPNALPHILLPAHNSRRISLIIKKNMPDTLSYPIYKSNSLTCPAQLIQAFSPPKKNFSITAEYNIFGIDPTSRTFIILCYIFPPKIIKFRICVCTDIIRFSSIQNVRPAEGPGMISYTCLIPVVSRVRSYNRLHQARITIFICLAYSRLVPLIQIFAHIDTIRNHIIIKSLIIRSCFSCSPLSFTGLKSVTQKESNPFLGSHRMPSGTIFFPIKFGAIRTLVHFHKSRIREIIVPSRTTRTTITIIDSSRVSHPTCLNTLY